MKRLSLTLLCSAGLLTSGCFIKNNNKTSDPDAAAEGAESGAPGANVPSRASASTTTRGKAGTTTGRVKTFEPPQPPREATVIPGAIDVPENLEIGEVRPSMAPAGSQVEIFGAGFGSDASAIKVTNGRQPWKVVEVYDDRIVAEVAGGSEGNLAVEIGKQSGATSNTFRVLQGDSAFESVSRDLHGLIGSVHRHEGGGIPDFASAELVGTIGLTNLSFDGTPASDFDDKLNGYAIRFTGSVNVTQEGEYDLCLATDGPSRLLIMDTLVLENAGEGSGCELVYLEAGEYDLAAEYARDGVDGNATFNLHWGFDGGKKTGIPAEQLFRP